MHSFPVELLGSQPHRRMVTEKQVEKCMCIVTLSVTERTLRVHSLGALHSLPGLAIWFMGSGCLVSGAGVSGLVILFTSLHSRKLTIRFSGNW